MCGPFGRGDAYIDGPFWADENLNSIKDKKQNLRDKIYNQMVERSKNSTYEFIEYKKVKNES